MKQWITDLEVEVVDKHGLADVLAALSDIAYEKAEHLRTNWQDAAAAKEWESDGKKLEQLASKLNH